MKIIISKNIITHTHTHTHTHRPSGPRRPTPEQPTRPTRERDLALSAASSVEEACRPRHLPTPWQARGPQNPERAWRNDCVLRARCQDADAGGGGGGERFPEKSAR